MKSYKQQAERLLVEKLSNEFNVPVKVDIAKNIAILPFGDKSIEVSINIVGNQYSIIKIEKLIGDGTLKSATELMDFIEQF
ncbi:MAG: hypothetical protein KKB31_07535 [Nanoarchaeota archaeon]|nr:hypothetical protein [Nanoarchaeota archaeon]